MTGVQTCALPISDEIETTVEKLDKEIKKNYSQVKRVFVEAEARKSSNPEKLPN